MKHTIAQSVRSLLSIIALVLLSPILQRHALGQPPAAAAHRGPQQPATDTVNPSLDANQPDAADPRFAIGDYCNPDYWIVSSRACPRDHGRGGICCQLQYVHQRGRLHRSNRQAFLASLRPGVPVCIVVHGSYVLPSDVSKDSLQIYRWLRAAAPELPLHVAFYTWPSKGIFTFNRHNPLTSLSPQLDVAILGRRAEFNGLYLARLISAVPAANPICLIGHSHGARVVSSSLHLLGGGRIRRYVFRECGNQRNRIRAVLAAAAIDHDWLVPGQRYDRALCRAECLLSLRNRHDLPLAFYPFRKPFGGRSLGRAGFTRKDRAALGWLNAKATELDVSQVVGRMHLWPGYYRHAAIACSIVPYVYFTDTIVEPETPTPDQVKPNQRSTDEQVRAVPPSSVR